MADKLLKFGVGTLTGERLDKFRSLRLFLIFTTILLVFQNCGRFGSEFEAAKFRELTSVGGGSNTLPPPDSIDFQYVYDNVLEPHCLSCHSGNFPDGNYSVETYSDVMSKGVIIPSNADGSTFYQQMDSGEMPTTGRISQNLIDDVRTWINNGANEFPPDTTTTTTTVTVTTGGPGDSTTSTTLPTALSDFEWLMQNVFEPHCFSCHNPQERDGDFDITTFNAIMESGFVIPFSASASLLWQVSDNASMPVNAAGNPSGRIEQYKIDRLANWINGGALDENGNAYGSCSQQVAYLPRLTKTEYRSILNDMLASNVPQSVTSEIAELPSVFGFDRMASPPLDRLSAERYLNVAEDLANLIITDANIRKSAAAGGPGCPQNAPFSSQNWQSCGVKIIKYVGQRLFRRPLRADEILRYKNAFNASFQISQNRIQDSTVDIQGFFDGMIETANGTYASGWAYDSNWPDRQVEIHLYIKPPGSGSGTYIGSTLTNRLRQDVNNALGIEGNRGWVHPIPPQYLDGTNREIRAFSIGTTNNKQLNNSPKTIAINSGVAGTNSTLGEFDTRFENAIADALTVLMMSPNFLFKMEFFPGGHTPSELPYKKAAMLSLATGQTYPDNTLFGYAQSGTLTPARITTEANRLVAKYSNRLAKTMGSQWFSATEGFDKPRNSLAYAFSQENRLVLNDIIQNNRSISSILTPGFTYANSVSGSHYGISGGTSPTDYKKVTTSERGGVLNQGSFLFSPVNSQESHPVQRGVWVLGNVVCRKLPTLDPASLEEINDAQAGIPADATVRERMELHRSFGPQCSSCHSQIDPIGLALENWDGTASFRTTYPNGDPVISDLDYNGQSVADPFELAQVLSTSAEFQLCTVKKVDSYISGADPYQPSSCYRTISGDAPLKEITVDALIEFIEGVSP